MAFKVRTQGTYNGSKGGKVKAGGGGAGVLWYQDKTFTIATHQDQWLLASDSHGSLSLSLSLSNQSMNPTPEGKPLRFLSVCSGMEAASIAFEPLGWKAVGFCEIDPFASAVLAHRFPNTPNYGDLTQHPQWPISNGDVDLIIGGPPCQAFSVAGLRRGLADPRGNLTLTYLGLVDRLRPEWVIYENVPGLLSVDGGRTFGTFLHALGQLGYGWAYRILDAQHVGECRLHPHRRGWSAVPQRRRRIFVVARRGAGGWASAAEVLSLREGLQRHLAAGGKKRQGVAPDAGGGAETGCWWDGGQVSQTLDAVLQKGQTMPEKNRFPAVLQPFRKSKRAQSKTDDESWVEGQQSNTLNNFDVGDTRTTHAVVEPLAFSAKDNGADATTGISPTLRSQNSVEGNQNSSWSIAIVQASELRLKGQISEQSTCPTLLANTKSGDNDPLAVHAISFQPGNLCRQAGADPSTTTFPTLKCDAGDQAPHVATAGFKWHQGEQAGSIGYQEGVAPTITTVKEPAVLHPVVPLDGMNLLSRLGECGETHSMQEFNPADPSFTLRRGGMQHGILTPMAVRRLTPNECLRLQGFPDNWTNIPWKGKTTAPDGPQYKCAGNSFAVPVVRWIGTRIAAQQ
jgi:DNA (cytosine-5)-methyltransferase 1